MPVSFIFEILAPSADEYRLGTRNVSRETFVIGASTVGLEKETSSRPSVDIGHVSRLLVPLLEQDIFELCLHLGAGVELEGENTREIVLDWIVVDHLGDRLAIDR